MGVPKFFRFLSERYPLINQTFDETMVPPEFDALYLDMNGIIHNCTHGDSSMELLSEEQMFLLIFQYIDRLFHMIKPCKLFYMAIDGVAPRAKLNQQRQRRFRTAKEAEDNQARALKQGNPIERPFDSNCITPGTEFMARLSEQLHFFIFKKMEEDAMWRRVNVIFSGHEVPGEGEHKIMEYIRHMKAQPDWNPNMRHCLYGLDADLIMLSLTTHEPHFSLLREDVLTRSSKKNSGSTAFQLLHISLLRQYLQLDFEPKQNSSLILNYDPKNSSLTPPTWDIERIIDDFVLLCFFIGNDFLPNLPGLDISEGHLNRMMDLYKDLLPRMKPPYLTNSTQVNWDNLEMFLKELATFERNMTSGGLDVSREEKLEQQLHAPDDLDELDEKLVK